MSQNQLQNTIIIIISKMNLIFLFKCKTLEVRKAEKNADKIYFKNTSHYCTTKSLNFNKLPKSLLREKLL